MINQARRLLDHVRSRGDLAASVLLQYIHQKQEPGLPLNQRELTPPKGLLLSKAMFKIAEIYIVFMSKAILDHPHRKNAPNTEGFWLCFENTKLAGMPRSVMHVPDLTKDIQDV